MIGGERARPTLREIYAALGGADTERTALWDRSELMGKMGRFLLSAARHGDLVGYQVHWPYPALDGPAPPRGRLIGPKPAAPAPPREAEARFFELAVVDEIGVPIPGLEVVFDVAGTHRVVTNGSGVARLDGVKESFGTARVPNKDLVRETLRARWDTVRPADWLEPQVDHTLLPLREAQELRASLLGETRHTLVIQPWVIRARLLGMFFDTNKAFLLPSAIDGIHGVKQLYQENPASTVLVVGHTDASGEASFNDPLSLERAEAVGAYLRDDVEPWLGWYRPDKPLDKRWGIHEDRLMLSAMPDAATRPAGESAVVWFQRTRGLTVDGVAGNETRRPLITEYMALDHTSLPADEQLVLHGCGESFPSDAPAEQGASTQSKQHERRVELYLFDGKLGVQPPPPGTISPPNSVEYPEWVRRAQETHDFELIRRADSLVLEWPDELTPFLPVDLAFELEWRGKKASLRWSEGTVNTGFRRFVFPDIRTTDRSTLRMLTGGRAILLWQDQLASDPADPPAWLAWLTDLLPKPDPSAIDAELAALTGRQAP